jgi:hypothetical protein
MKNGRFRLVTTLLVAVAILAAADPAFSQLGVTLNQTAFHPGEVLQVTITTENEGPAFSADVYLGVRLPDGAAAFLTSLSPPNGTVMAVDVRPSLFPRRFADLFLPTGLESTVLDVGSFTIPEELPLGDYSLFAVLTGAGALVDDRVDPDDRFAITAQHFTVADLGTGLKTAAIEVSPSSPTVDDDIAIRLSGVWPDSCAPHSPQVRITGSEVRIDTAGVPPGVLCATVLTPWELVVPGGQLPVGSYRIVVIHSSQGQVLELGRKAFDVR